MTVREPIVDYYVILGVHPTAEDIVIRAAYKALAQRYHPDRFPGPKDEAHRRMSDLTKAYEVLADPVRRPKYDRRRVAYTHSFAARFNGTPKYASPALAPDELRSAAANRGKYRAAFFALMIVVVALSTFNLVQYSTRLKGWLGTTMPTEPTPVRAKARAATDAPVAGTAGAKLDDMPQAASSTNTRSLPISQSSAAAVESAASKPQPPVPRLGDPAAATGTALANRSGNVPARQPTADARRSVDAPATVSPADVLRVKEDPRVAARNAPVDRPAKSQPMAAASDPCRDAVAALGLCSPNTTVKKK
jgi:hypothetical protein